MNDTYFISYVFYKDEDKMVYGNGVYEVTKNANFLNVLPEVERQLTELKGSEVVIINFIKSNTKSVLKGLV